MNLLPEMDMALKLLREIKKMSEEHGELLKSIDGRLRKIEEAAEQDKSSK